MKIDDLIDNQGNVNIDLKIIYDRMPEKEYKGRKVKTVVVVDASSEKGGTTALLDLYDDDVKKYKFQDKIKVINGFAKKIKTKRKGEEQEQFLITYGYANQQLVGRYEKIL